LLVRNVISYINSWDISKNYLFHHYIITAVLYYFKTKNLFIYNKCSIDLFTSWVYYLRTNTEKFYQSSELLFLNSASTNIQPFKIKSKEKKLL
jgi:hypothetical protein